MADDHLSVSSCAVMGTLLALFSPLIPHIYNTEPAIRELASSVIRTAALCMPLFAFANAAYFTLRSGGKTLITFFFDSCYTWLINFPIAFVLSRYTALPLPIVYLFVNGVDLLKCIIGFILVKRACGSITLWHPARMSRRQTDCGRKTHEHPDFWHQQKL